MFNIDKSKEEVAAVLRDSTGQNKQQDAIDNIGIHVMPAQFRGKNAGAQAQTTGAIILVVGFVLIVGLAGGAYYYFMIKKGNLFIDAGRSPEIATTTATSTNSVTEPTSPTEPIPDVPISEPTPSTTPETVVSTTPTTTPIIVPTASPVTDSDNDGLNDEEEVLIGTDKNNPDTDADGFQDGAELAVGYNPAGPGKIISNVKIKMADESSFTILYPADWSKKIQTGVEGVMFQSPDNQFFQVSWQTLDAGQNLTSWYKATFNQVEPSLQQLIDIKDDTGKIAWPGVKSPDNKAVYIANGGKLYTIAYNTGVDGRLLYEHLFSMAYNSFRLK